MPIMAEGDDEMWQNKTYTLQLIDDAYFVGFDASTSKLASKAATTGLSRELKVFPSAIFAPGGSQIQLAGDDSYLEAACGGASDSGSTVGSTATQATGSNFTFVTPDSAMGVINEEQYCVAQCPPPDVLSDVDAYETCFTTCQAKHARGFQIAACNETVNGTKYLYASMEETSRGKLFLTDDPRRASYFYLFDVRATPARALLAAPAPPHPHPLLTRTPSHPPHECNWTKRLTPPPCSASAEYDDLVHGVERRGVALCVPRVHEQLGLPGRGRGRRLDWRRQADGQRVGQQPRAL